MKPDLQQHDRLVASLAQALALRLKAKATVRQTHISSVILCGKYAYKLKRPVRLPFVDFSSIDARHHYCQEELRLNQRTAPDLYLGVCAITKAGESVEIDGLGVVLDWAVKMLRFPKEAMLTHIIKYNELDNALVQKLAISIAKLHNSQPALDIQKVHETKSLLRWLLGSLDEIATARPDHKLDVNSVKRFANSFVKEHRYLLKKRSAQGLYKECHGDLHLGNLIFWNNEIVPFDALEFNAELRTIDILNDIAFPFMDLLAHNCLAQAWLLINAWCEQTADYEGLPLLRYYTLYRAVVRAKVAALTLDSSEFDRYWTLAKCLIHPPHAPRLILVAGLSGSGKSTVARSLVPMLSGIRLSTDVMRKKVHLRQKSSHQNLYTQNAIHRNYCRLADISKDLMSSNFTVIVDASFLQQRHVALFESLARKFQINTEVILCNAPTKVLQRRIVKRALEGKDPSDATLHVLKKQMNQLEKKPIRWLYPPTIIATNTSRLMLIKPLQDAINKP